MERPFNRVCGAKRGPERESSRQYGFSYWGVRNLVLGSTDSRTPVEGSAQTGTESAGAYNTFIDKTYDKTYDNKAENSLKDLASKGEESKSEQNFQLGEEEKFGLETKSLSAEPEVLEEALKNELPPSSNGSSPSAGNPLQSSQSGGPVLDPRTGKVQNYAELPAWARSLVAGLLNLRRERENLIAMLPGARGAEVVKIRARIQEIDEELAYNEARLTELLAQEGQASNPAEALVAVGGGVRG